MRSNWFYVNERWNKKSQNQRNEQYEILISVEMSAYKETLVSTIDIALWPWHNFAWKDLDQNQN